MRTTQPRAVRSKSEAGGYASCRRGAWRNLFFFLINFLLPPNVLSAQVNVLTANYDNSRTNANPYETLLGPRNVSTDSFGKIGSFPVDGQIYAQPLYVDNVQIPGKGSAHVVYTATMHNTVYAIDADAPGSVVPIWQVNLGASVPSSGFEFSDILPEVGILSTPVIDLGRQVIYIVSDTLEQGVPVFRMHALSLADGHEMLHGPVVISASVPGSGSGCNGGMLPFDASMQLQRPGLALVNGTVYAAFGAHADAGSFHGWMIGYDASDLRRRVAVFNATPNSWGGSLWQAGRAPAIDSQGNIYAVTGNGDFTGESDFGDSVVKLSGRNLALLDWYTPDNWFDLRDDDADLGSAGAVLLPGDRQLLTIGKSGDLLLIDSESMGHVGPMHSATVQSFSARGAGIFGFALWNREDGPLVYLEEPSGEIHAYRIANGHLDAGVLSENQTSAPTYFGGIAVSANGSVGGTGIVWQTTGDYDARQVPGTLHAFDAADLSRELWNSEMVPDRDRLGRFAKFVAPTVVNGRVYVPTFSNQLAIYGLLSDAGPANSDMEITAVVNGASLLGGAVAPGELVAIFGAHIGPPQSYLAEVDASGHASKLLANTQVLFDGVPAPLLYAASGELDAIVPFGIAGPTAQLQIVYQGKRSAPIDIPVALASPALFARDGTGGGPGAILNADGSVNSFDNPASLGSAVVLYGTGLGQTDPPGDDGNVAGRATLPAPVLPVRLLMDGQPAEIAYAGSAPGMVEGMVQVNARIPASVTPGPYVRVVLEAGDFISPSTITLSVRSEP